MPKKRSDELHEGRAAGNRVSPAVRQVAAEDGVTLGTVSRLHALAGTPERWGDRGGAPGSRTGDFPLDRDTLCPAFDDRSRRSRATETSPSRASGHAIHGRLPQPVRQKPTAFPRGAISPQPRLTVLAYPHIEEPRDVCRQEAQSRCDRSFNCARMRTVAPPTVHILDKTSPRYKQCSRHYCPALRSRRIPISSGMLTAPTPQPTDLHKTKVGQTPYPQMELVRTPTRRALLTALPVQQSALTDLKPGRLLPTEHRVGFLQFGTIRIGLAPGKNLVHNQEEN